MDEVCGEGEVRRLDDGRREVCGYCGRLAAGPVRGDDCMDVNADQLPLELTEKRDAEA